MNEGETEMPPGHFFQVFNFMFDFITGRVDLVAVGDVQAASNRGFICAWNGIDDDLAHTSFGPERRERNFVDEFKVCREMMKT